MGVDCRLTAFEKKIGCGMDCKACEDIDRLREGIQWLALLAS